MRNEESLEFDRSKIYEKLDSLPVPKDYSSKVDWTIQNQIANTNGKHYIDRVGQLNEIPFYEMPVPKVKGNKLLLDIGSGWGRWLISGAAKGYIPVGIELRLDYCKTQQKVMKGLGIKGYSVVADLEKLPFKESIFDLVWSYSVLQHTHKERLVNCLKCINTLLKPSGYTQLEFPNINGIRNRFGTIHAQRQLWDDYNHWCVRYYSIEEYRRIISTYLADFTFSNHSFLGIGVLKEDIKYVSFKNKILCSLSLMMSSLTTILPSLTNYSDSIYVKAVKQKDSDEEKDDTNLESFYNRHHQSSFDNLSIVPLLKCPASGGSLELSSDRKKLISKEAALQYPVVNSIPILIISEAIAI